MKHAIKQKKLNRDSAHRKSLLQNLAKSLITHEQIVTTEAKAKALKPFVEKLVTLGKKGDLSSRRRALSILFNDKETVSKLFTVIAERYKKREGGYTRVIKYGFRKGDSAPKAVIEFVDRDVEAKGKRDIERVIEERKVQQELEQ